MTYERQTKYTSLATPAGRIKIGALVTTDPMYDSQDGEVVDFHRGKVVVRLFDDNTIRRYYPVYLTVIAQ